MKLLDCRITAERLNRAYRIKASAEEVSDRLECAGVKIGSNVAEAFDRAASKQNNPRRESACVKLQGVVVPEMVQEETAGRVAVTGAEVVQYRLLLGEGGEERGLVGVGMVDEEFVVPKQHGSSMFSTACADTFEQLAV